MNRESTSRLGRSLPEPCLEFTASVRGQLFVWDPVPLGIIAVGGEFPRSKYANDAVGRLLGSGGSSPFEALPPSFQHRPTDGHRERLLDVCSDGERRTLHLVASSVDMRCFPGITHVVVVEDVSDLIFDGGPPESFPVEGHVPFSVDPCLDPRILTRAQGSGLALAEQMIEPLWTPILLLRGGASSVIYSNRAARTHLQFGFGARFEAEASSVDPAIHLLSGGGEDAPAAELIRCALKLDEEPGELVVVRPLDSAEFTGDCAVDPLPNWRSAG